VKCAAISHASAPEVDAASAGAIGTAAAATDAGGAPPTSSTTAGCRRWSSCRVALLMGSVVYFLSLEIFDPSSVRLYIRPFWPITNPTMG